MDKSIIGDNLARAITTDFPALNIDKAVEAVETFERSLKGKAQNAEAFAKVQGYKSAKNGAFINFVADLRRYGLLERREYTSTELAKKIFLAKGEQKNNYIFEAINKVILFTNLINKIGKEYENANFQAVLIDNGFSGVDALKNETTIKNIYKKIVPYITKDTTNAPYENKESDSQKGENINNYDSLLANEQNSNAQKDNQTIATLISDGISLRILKNKDTIEFAKLYLDRLEKKIAEESKEK